MARDRLWGSALFLFGLFGLVALAGSCPDQQSQAGQEPRWVEAIFPTEGMTCSGCEAAIKGAVTKLPGVKTVQASHQEKVTRVTYDPGQVAPEQIIATINKLGYKAGPPRPPAPEQ